jgi:hypothetical protein
VTEFEAEAFAFCISLKSISIPPSLVHIQEGGFREDELLSEVIFESPSQLTSIGSDSFLDCSELCCFYIPPCLKNIDGSSFARSGIRDVDVDPENVWFR